MSVRLSMVCLAVLATTACSKRDDSSSRVPTEAQRDSVIARSSLPGAAVVGSAIAVSKRSETRSAGFDSLTR